MQSVVVELVVVVVAKIDKEPVDQVIVQVEFVVVG